MALNYEGPTIWPQLKRCFAALNILKSPAGSKVPELKITLFASSIILLRKTAGFRQMYSIEHSSILFEVATTSFPSEGLKLKTSIRL